MTKVYRTLWQLACYGLLGVVFLGFIGAAPPQQQGPVMRAAAFIDTLGVNTHIGSDPYNDPAKIASMLTYLGIENVRQTSPIDDSSMANMKALGKLGAKIDLIVNGGGPVDLPGAMATVKELAPYLNAVEGVNEAAIWPIEYKGIKGIDAAVALQKDLYAAVRAEPSLANAPVYIFTLGGVDPDKFPQIGDMSAYTDFANIHSYPPHGLRPIFVIHAAIDGGRTSAPSKPVVVTETGYYTLPQNTGWGGVPEGVQASYILGLLLDQAAAGTARTYLYDLIDDGPDPERNNREHNFGLFRFDGTPKPSATAIHNMTTLLADARPTNRTFDLTDLGFTAPGVPYNHTGNTMRFQKSDGTQIIALWNQQQLWDPDTQTATPLKHIPVIVDLEKSYGTVQVFDPLVGKDALQTLRNVSQVTIDLTDHPLFLVIPPNGGQTELIPTPIPELLPALNPPLVPLPTTRSTIVLHVSEDAWQGDAQFTISIDGAQIGGVHSATASHAMGELQTVSVSGDWGAGPHTIGISFINDAWGGTDTTDRNLYVDRVTYDGQTANGFPVAIFRNDTANFVVPPAGTGMPLTVHLAQDEWQGDAQYLVSIDGVFLAQGVVTALNARGLSQAIDLHPKLLAGPHDKAIAFLNDAYGGTWDTDRNLHVKGIDLNGTSIPNTAFALLRTETAHFQILVPQS